MCRAEEKHWEWDQLLVISRSQTWFLPISSFSTSCPFLVIFPGKQPPSLSHSPDGVASSPSLLELLLPD